MNHQHKSQKGFPNVHQDLVKALEGARTRLAVAIAVETKATPLERWNYYLETADRIRKCLKQLRTLPRSVAKSQPGWIGALDILRQIPQRPDLRTPHGEARLLCQHLEAVLERIGPFAD